jgi:hypothetical protein
MTVGIYETYSKRLKKRERAGQPDIYQYDDLPKPLRVQIVQIWRSAIGRHIDRFSYRETDWADIHDALARELGRFSLGDPRKYASVQCETFLLNASTDEALDIIELTFLYLDQIIRNKSGSLLDEAGITQSADEAIEELNYRFKEHGVGYQFEGGEIVRVDSQYVHAEAVKPAISLLNAAGFEGASDEFLKAHEHYRKGRFGEAMTEALKAFESTMKAICDENGWSYAANATAKPLISKLLGNGLVPQYMETHLAGLRNTLEAGLPTMRNKNSGHGQGALRKQVPDYFAGYALHLAATNIVFLVEAHKALNRK